MALTRRGPARTAAPAVGGGSVNFGDDGFYSGGLGLPEGDYACTFHTAMFQPTKQNGQPVGPAFLSVMLTAYPMKNGEFVGEPSEHPLGCGRQSHLSFVPSADGKGFDAVAGGSSIGMNDLTNWSLFRKSLRDCGLPVGILQSNLGVLDGIWVHTQNIAEPEERKALRSATGEAAMAGGEQQSNRPRTCPVVTEIKEGGKPWEGTGGLPEENGAAGSATAAMPKTAAAPVSRGAATRRIAPAPVQQQAASSEITEEDIRQAAMQAMTDHLVKPANNQGCTRVSLRTGTFQGVNAKYGDDMAQAVMEVVFANDDGLNAVLAELGYFVAGDSVKVAP